MPRFELLAHEEPPKSRSSWSVWRLGSYLLLIAALLAWAWLLVQYLRA